MIHLAVTNPRLFLVVMGGLTGGFFLIGLAVGILISWRVFREAARQARVQAYEAQVKLALLMSRDDEEDTLPPGFNVNKLVEQCKEKTT